jgi:hypothetical protein
MQTENFLDGNAGGSEAPVICIEDGHLTRCKPFREESAMTLFQNSRFLAVYSGVLTFAFVLTVFYGASAARNQTFDTISVRRINIVEPDGTVRLTISNRADFAYRDKKEYPRPDRRNAAGMLFMSEEGTEMGGLIWGAHQNPDGSLESHGHLSFDEYEDNQIFAIDAGQEGTKSSHALISAIKMTTRLPKKGARIKNLIICRPSSGMQAGGSFLPLTGTM